MEAPKTLHFFKPLINPNFHNQLLIPTHFLKHLKGQACCDKAVLKTNYSSKRWVVSVDGRRIMGGWSKFVKDHALHLGDFLVFRHEGNMVFHVLVFDPSACEKVYRSSNFANNEATENDTSKDVKDCNGSKEIKNRKYSNTTKNPSFVILKPSYKKPRILEERTEACSIKGMDRGCIVKEERTSKSKITTFTHGDSYFYGTIFPRHLTYYQMKLPIDFANSNGLREKVGQYINLRYKNEGSWQVLLRQDKYNGHAYLGKGWNEFAVENNLKVGGEFKLEFINRESTFFMNYHDGSKEIKKRNMALKPSHTKSSILEVRTKACSIEGIDRGCIVKEETTSKAKTITFTHGDSYFYGTIYPTHLTNSQLRFPMEFARENGLRSKCGYMILRNQGSSWQVLLKHKMSDGTVYLGAGWQQFAVENGLRVGDKFKLELIKGGKMLVMNYYGATDIGKRCGGSSNHV